MKRKTKKYIDVTNVKVEQGIPIISPRKGSAGKSKYPIEIMAVGDSFFLPEITTFNAATLNVAAKKQGLKAHFVYRRIYNTRGRQIGIRIWRDA